MPYDTPLVRRVVSLATVALFFFAVIGAFAVDNEPDDSDLAKDRDGLSTTDSTAPAEVGAGDPNAPTLTTPTAPAPGDGQAATTAVSRGGGGGGGGGTSAIGPAKPPQPGTYRYKQTVTRDGDKSESDAEDKVEAVSADGNVTRQRRVIRQGPITAIDTLAWSPDAVRIETSRFEVTGGAFDCDWNPDVTELVLPLAAGKAWAVDSTCTATAEGRSFTIHRTGDYRVSEQKRVDVGGTPVNVWVVEGKTIVDTSGAITQHQESEGTVHFSPEHGLRVYQKEVTKGDQGNATVERKLTSLKPR